MAGKTPTLLLFSLTPSRHRLLVLALLRLHGREVERLAHASRDRLPLVELELRRPGQHADPRLHVVVQLQRNVVRVGELARRGRDGVLSLLILEIELAPAARQSQIPAAVGSIPFNSIHPEPTSPPDPVCCLQASEG